MIGKKIKEYRQGLKFTGETLANLAGIKRSWLSQIENEKKVPPIDTFMALINAIARLSLINDENAPEILTEEGYKDFRSLINPYKRRFIVYTDDNHEKYEFNDSRCTVDVSFDNIKDSFSLTIEKPFDEVTNEDIEQRLRTFYFFDYDYNRGGNLDMIGIKNLLMDDIYLKNSIYHYEQVRQDLYEWWFNHILQDFYKATVDLESPTAQGELDIQISIGALANQDGVFIPFSDNETTNIVQDLLNGKTISFDLKFFKDKNLYLSLDDKKLSKKEVEIMDVALGAIRYFREND